MIAQKVIDRDEEYNYYMYPFTFSNNHTSTIQQRMEKIRKRAKVKVNSSIFEVLAHEVVVVSLIVYIYIKKE